MSEWKLFIRKYSIVKNDYIVEERIVRTNDIYHTIGEIYCTTLEDIKRIDYYEIDSKYELQRRIEEAIEYIENCSGIYKNALGEKKEMVSSQNVLDILKGDDVI